MALEKIVEMTNCDDCNLILPYDPALELTKIFYQCERNKEMNYYKSDILATYKYFRGEIEGKDECEEEN